MSLLHRSLIAQILAGLEPVVEGAVIALVPGGVALEPLVHAGLTAAENVADSVHADPVAVAGTTVNSPLPVAPVAPPAPVAPAVEPAPAAPAAVPVPAGEKLQASDVVNALLDTLLKIQAKL